MIGNIFDTRHAENYDISESVVSAGDTKDIITNNDGRADLIVVGAYLGQTSGAMRNFRIFKRTKDRRLLPISDNSSDSKIIESFIILQPSEGIAVTFDAAADVANLAGVVSAVKRSR